MIIYSDEPSYWEGTIGKMVIVFKWIIIEKMMNSRGKIAALPYFDEAFIELQQKQASVSSAIATINYREKLLLFINHDGYNLCMAILTVYSIFAIDFVKSFSHQPVAFIFGYIHIIAIFVFTIEMILNAILKQKYVFSFYFWIDLVSTVSMIMEIPWVDNWLVDNSSLPAVFTLAKVIKASRLSRIGGRAAKILLIVINYYKNKKNEQEEEIRNKQTKNTQSVIGQSNFKTESIIDNKFKAELENEEEEITNIQMVLEPLKKVEMKSSKLQPISEERISQKSNESDQNTQQQRKNTQKNKSITAGQFLLLGKRRSKLAKISQRTSPFAPQPRKTFEINNIVQRLQQTFKLQPLNRVNVDPVKAMELEKKWQQLLQREQQLKNQSKEKIKSNKENFKLGQSLKSQIQKNIIIMIMSLIIILPLISAQTWLNNDPTIDLMMDSYFNIAANMSDTEAFDYLSMVVSTSFATTSPILYLTAQINNRTYTYPDDFPALTQPDLPISDYMQCQKIFSDSRPSYYIIFNDRATSRMNSIINIIRSCFITILLIFSTIIFMYSIEMHALIPLESMCVSINKISINPFDALKEVNEQKEESLNKNDIETNILEKAIWRMTNLLVIGAGQQGSELISSMIDENQLSNKSLQVIQGRKMHGIFMFIKLTNYDLVFEEFNDNLLDFINKISGEMHEIIIKNGGIILQNACPYFLCFWKTPDDLNIEMETTNFLTANNPLKNLGKTIETQKMIQLALRTYLQISMALFHFNKSRIDEYLKDKYEDLFEQFILQAGLHIGDGYVGSVGSNLKIEIKCLGKDIEFAKNLCNLAGSYGVSNILSDEICEILDDHEPNYIRKLDYVKQYKSGNIFWLYTFDFSLLPLIYPQKYQTHIKLKKRKTSKMRSFTQKNDRNALYKKRGEILARIKNQPIQSVVPLNYHQKSCQKMFSFQFYDTWNEALEKFYVGEWQQATMLFESMKEFYLMSYNDILSCMMLERIRSLQGIDIDIWNKVQVIYFE